MHYLDPKTLRPHSLLSRITTIPEMAKQYEARAVGGGKARKEYLATADELRAEFAALVESIKLHGIREPLRVYNNTIVDGRHRWLAAIEAGLDTVPVELVEAEEVSDVIQDAVTRRHFTKGALAYMHVILHPALSEKKPGKSQLSSETTIGNQEYTECTIAEAAAKIGVSRILLFQAIELYRLATRYKKETAKIDSAVWAGMGLGALIAGIKANKDALEKGEELPSDATKPSRVIDYATIGLRSTTSLTNAFDRWDDFGPDIQETLTQNLRTALAKLPLVTRHIILESL